MPYSIFSMSLSNIPERSSLIIILNHNRLLRLQIQDSLRLWLLALNILHDLPHMFFCRVFPLQNRIRRWSHIAMDNSRTNSYPRCVAGNSSSIQTVFSPASRCRSGLDWYGQRRLRSAGSGRIKLYLCYTRYSLASTSIQTTCCESRGIWQAEHGQAVNKRCWWNSPTCLGEGLTVGLNFRKLTCITSYQF